MSSISAIAMQCPNQHPSDVNFCFIGGEVDNEELGDVLRGMGMKPTDKQLAAILYELDEDKSGSVSFPEFLKLMVRLLCSMCCATSVLSKDGEG